MPSSPPRPFVLYSTPTYPPARRPRPLRTPPPPVLPSGTDAPTTASASPRPESPMPRVRKLILIGVCALVAAVAVLVPAVAALRSGVECRLLKNPITMAGSQCMCTPCHVCELAIKKLKCQLITGDKVDTSDGSEFKPEQPALDPKAWFLTADDIAAARGGVERADLSVFTEGNKVEAFTSGEAMFLSVAKDVQKTDANDSIYLTAWSVDDVPFDPKNDKTGNKTGFKALMGGAVKRGADFRAIVWPNLIERKQNVEMRNFINALPAPPFSGPARFIFDDRLTSQTSSHHQKSLIVRHKNELVAYVGGIDLTSDRWDTPLHDQAALRKEAGIYSMFDGWLDAHLRIQGPATKDIGANFLGRWNSKKKPSQDAPDDWLDFENPEYSALPALDKSGPLNLKTNSKHSVQIVRTFSCKYKYYEEFAPKGERSLLEARIKAIRQAKNYIYIEDQYFILVPELLEALLEVLPKLQRLIVVAQRTLSETKITGYEKYLFDMVAPIQKRFPNKFQLYTTKESKKLYIHSKLVIIDDTYVSTGSANWNRRSMTSDSEIGANVVDTETVQAPDGILVTKFARDFRIRKFMEHTGKSYDELDKLPLIDAANTFDAAAKDPKTIIEVLEVQEKATYAAFTDFVRQQIDPDDKC